MFTISQGAIEQAVRDIQAGVEYPDFWTDRYEETEQGKEKEEKPKEEK